MITVSPENFAQQMAYVAHAGYRTVGATELADFLAGGVLAPKSIVLTFDDGYLDSWIHAYPVLRLHGLTAINFLVTAWVGEGAARSNALQSGAYPTLLNHADCEIAIKHGEHDRAILRWSEIDKMQESGTFEFHSHTHEHVRWDQQESGSVERKCTALSRDLRQARVTLIDKLGSVSDHLCWPQGYYDDDYKRIAKEVGFRHFYTCEPGPNYPCSDLSDTCSITRLEVRNRSASWLASRLWVHSRPLLSKPYLKIKR